MSREEWHDGRLVDLAVRVLDGEVAWCDGVLRSPAHDNRPAELSLDDVVASGRAAYCWLDVVVWLRDVPRHHGWAGGASTDHEPGH
ncbi:hypothetical protein ACI782_05375 [Geodermatophilus sp. SYSU D00703]